HSTKAAAPKSRSSRWGDPFSRSTSAFRTGGIPDRDTPGATSVRPGDGHHPSAYDGLTRRGRRHLTLGVIVFSNKVLEPTEPVCSDNPVATHRRRPATVQLSSDQLQPSQPLIVAGARA